MKNQPNNILTDDNQQIISEIVTASTYKPRQSCILFGVTEDDRIREETERQVGEGLKEIRSIQYMDLRHYRENYTEFLPALRELSERESCFIFVRGLDDLISLDISLNRMVGSRPLILNYLNMNREFFLAYPTHILFWISPETEIMLFNQAPDLWAFRTHSHFFDEIVREEPPDLSSLKIIELVPYEGKRENLERDIEIKEKLLLKFLAEDGAKLSYQALGLLKELAVRYYLKSDYGKAQVYAEKVVEGKTESGREGEEKNDPELLNILGLCYGRNKESGKAVELLEKALKAAEEKYIYRDWKGVLLNNLGVLFYWRENWEKAGEYFDKALKNTPSPEKPEDGEGREDRESGEGGSYSESRDKYNRIFILSNRGTVLFREMKLKEAGERYFESIKTLFENESILAFHWDKDKNIKTFYNLYIEGTINSLISAINHAINSLINKEVDAFTYLPNYEIANIFENCSHIFNILGNYKVSAAILTISMKFYNFAGNEDYKILLLKKLLLYEGLSVLDLCGLDLVELTLSSPHLKSLKILNLSYNKLTTTPKGIENLTHLDYLNISNNLLNSISSDIANLTNMNFLNLANNELESIPLEIGKLTDIIAIVLSQNQIKYIPKEIGHLENLKGLNLSNNQLQFIPLEIGNLINLEGLILSNNQLQLIPPEIKKLKNLSFLDLRNNPLPIPDEILAKTDSPSEILDYYFNKSNG